MKRIWALGLILAALSLSGCAMRTVEDLYALPKRSEEYDKLQSAIDIAMAGLDYAAPLSGRPCRPPTWTGTAERNIWSLPRENRIGPCSC